VEHCEVWWEFAFFLRRVGVGGNGVDRCQKSSVKFREFRAYFDAEPCDKFVGIGSQLELTAAEID